MDFSVSLFEHLVSLPLKVLPLFDATLSRLLLTLCKASVDFDQLVSIESSLVLRLLMLYIFN